MNGGPAFPISYVSKSGVFTREVTTYAGLSMRDYFAAAALTGLLAPEAPYFGTQGAPSNPWPWLATEAYRAADAMLAARAPKEAS